MNGELVLWGTPPWGGPLIKIIFSTRRHCEGEMLIRQRFGWRNLTVLPVGQAPGGGF